jgi:hypothetical protein
VRWSAGPQSPTAVAEQFSQPKAPLVQSSHLLSPKQLRKSVVIALAISLPLSIFGFAASMGLAHSGGPLLLLFLPTWPVFALFGSGGPFAGVPEGLFLTLAVLAEFVGVFVVVHLIAVLLLGAESDA